MKNKTKKTLTAMLAVIAMASSVSGTYGITKSMPLVASATGMISAATADRLDIPDVIIGFKGKVPVFKSGYKLSGYKAVDCKDSYSYVVTVKRAIESSKYVCLTTASKKYSGWIVYAVTTENGKAETFSLYNPTSKNTRTITATMLNDSFDVNSKEYSLYAFDIATVAEKAGFTLRYYTPTWDNVSGATFVLIKDNNKNGTYESKVDTVIGYKTTDANGRIETNASTVEVGQPYLISLVKAPEGYLDDKTMYSFVVKEQCANEVVALNVLLPNLVAHLKKGDDYGFLGVPTMFTGWNGYELSCDSSSYETQYIVYDPSLDDEAKTICDMIDFALQGKLGQPDVVGQPDVNGYKVYPLYKEYIVYERELVDGNVTYTLYNPTSKTRKKVTKDELLKDAYKDKETDLINKNGCPDFRAVFIREKANSAPENTTDCTIKGIPPYPMIKDGDKVKINDKEIGSCDTVEAMDLFLHQNEINEICWTSSEGIKYLKTDSKRSFDTLKDVVKHHVNNEDEYSTKISLLCLPSDFPIYSGGIICGLASDQQGRTGGIKILNPKEPDKVEIMTLERYSYAYSKYIKSKISAYNESLSTCDTYTAVQKFLSSFGVDTLLIPPYRI